MASYYYLVASLPMLRFEADPPISMEQFLASCRQSMGDKDFLLVKGLVDGNLESIQDECRYLAQWKLFLNNLHISLNEARSIALSRTDDNRHTTTDKDFHIQEVVKLAMQAETPLEAELLLMHFQWKYAEDLLQSRVFDREVLFTYAIQLALLERKSLFTPMEGNAEFKRLFSNLQSIIKSI